MDLDRLQRWLSLCANLAIIGGIVFLAIEINQNSEQIQQNTAVSKSEAVYQLNQSIDNYYLQVAQNSTLAELAEKGNENPELLTSTESIQFNFLMRKLINGHEASYFFHSQGIADDDYMTGANAALCNRVSTNGGKWFWERNSQYYADGFAKIVESCF